uniref:Uncharacterized protein n=1 Tax=Arundo donax TaxID=35708 RepID=A0A0A9GW83_ARUDO
MTQVISIPLLLQDSR